jgi:hypothetical protein
MTKSHRFDDLKKSIVKAAVIRGLIQRRDAGTFASGFGVLLADFEDLIDEGRSVEALELIELTMHKMETVWDQVDDSKGDMGDVFRELQIQHHDACKAVKPDRKKLARHLFDWALASDYDAFHDAPEVYAEVLGIDGMVELGRLIDDAFAHGADEWGKGHTTRLLRDWSVTLADRAKDFDKLLQVLTRDVSSSHRFLEIAQACRRYGRMDLAVAWAEKGVRTPFRGGVSPSLKSFLAHLYADQGKIDPAFKLLWGNFEQASVRHVEAYRELKEVGEKVGFWKDWQELALDHLRTEKSKDSLIRVLISDGLLRKANEEAALHGCSIPVWTELAEALADDGELQLAYSTYKDIFGFTMKEYNGTHGRSKVHETIRKMWALATQMGKQVEFEVWLEQMKTLFKRRTGFLNDLKRLGP